MRWYAGESHSKICRIPSLILDCRRGTLEFPRTRDNAGQACAADIARWGRGSSAAGTQACLGGAHQLDEFLYFHLEAAAVAGERARRGENVGGRRAGGGRAAVDVDDIGGDLAGAVSGFLDVA